MADQTAATNPPTKPSPTPWYYSAPLIIVSLLLCFPIGVVLMWAGKRFPMTVRVVVTVFFALVVLAAALGDKGKQPKTKPNPAPTASQGPTPAAALQPSAQPSIPPASPAPGANAALPSATPPSPAPEVAVASPTPVPDAGPSATERYQAGIGCVRVKSEEIAKALAGQPVGGGSSSVLDPIRFKEAADCLASAREASAKDPAPDREIQKLAAQLKKQQERYAADEPKRQKAAAAEAKRRAKELELESREKALETLRGPKPRNTAWDGSIRAVEHFLKERMNDPDSYEHVATTEPVARGEYWLVKSSFRGKNAFGGKVLNSKLFYIQQGEVVRAADVE